MFWSHVIASKGFTASAVRVTSESMTLRLSAFYNEDL